MSVTSARPLMVIGIVTMVITVILTAVLLVFAQRRYDDAVRGLARAPVGCDTTLEFTSTGRFSLFIETEGVLGELVGGCDAPATYRRESERPPRVQMLLVGPAGDETPLDRAEPVPYSSGGFSGWTHRTFEVVNEGDHVIRVTSADDGFVVAVGRHPDDAAYPVEQAAIASAILGGLLGVVLVVWGVATGRSGAARREPEERRSHELGPPHVPPGSPPLSRPPLSRPPLGPPPLPPPDDAPVSPPGLPAPGPFPPPPPR